LELHELVHQWPERARVAVERITIQRHRFRNAFGAQQEFAQCHTRRIHLGIEIQCRLPGVDGGVHIADVRVTFGDAGLRQRIVWVERIGSLEADQRSRHIAEEHQQLTLQRTRLSQLGIQGDGAVHGCQRRLVPAAPHFEARQGQVLLGGALESFDCRDQEGTCLPQLPHLLQLIHQRQTQSGILWRSPDCFLECLQSANGIATFAQKDTSHIRLTRQRSILDLELCGTQSVTLV
jgi:hypothetical protein